MSAAAAGAPAAAGAGPSGLTRGQYRAIVVRGVKEARTNHVTNLAQAIAYCAFLAIPSALLVALGLFADPGRQVDRRLADDAALIGDAAERRRPAQHQPHANHPKQRAASS